MSNDPIFTDYEIRVLKEIIRRSDMVFAEQQGESEEVVHPDDYNEVAP